MTGFILLSWLTCEDRLNPSRGHTCLASWLNPTPHLDKLSSLMEKAHFFWSLILTPILSYEREWHFDVELPSALNELKSTNRRCNWVCGCPGVAGEPTPHPHTLWKYWVRVISQREEPDIGKFFPWMRTSGTSCDWEGWIYRDKPVLGPDLRHDLFDREHFERQTHEWAVQKSQI